MYTARYFGAGVFQSIQLKFDSPSSRDGRGVKKRGSLAARASWSTPCISISLGAIGMEGGHEPRTQRLSRDNAYSVRPERKKGVQIKIASFLYHTHSLMVTYRDGLEETRLLFLQSTRHLNPSADLIYHVTSCIWKSCIEVKLYFKCRY